MEKRALLAIALSVAILLAWQILFDRMNPSPPSRPAPAPTSPAEEPRPPAAGPQPGPAPAMVPRSAPPGESGGGGAVLRTPLYRATFGADGAVTEWSLRYRGDKPLLVGGALGPLAVGISRPGEAPEVVPLRPDEPRLDVTAAEPTGTLRFNGVARDGTRIQKTLEVRADSYEIRVQLRAEGSGTGPMSVAVYWTSPVLHPGVTPGGAGYTFGEGPDHRQLLGRILVATGAETLTAFDAPAAALKDPKETELKDPHLVAAEVVPTAGGWVALEDDYFIAALIPPPGAELLRARERDLVEAGLVFARIEPGSSWEAESRLYVGPKEWNRLKALGVGLEQAQARNYGHLLGLPWVPMWWFCVPVLWLMNFFGTHIPGQNYGVAIILLTVVVKALFYPLSQKSMISMKQMQALQPQLNALRSKYRSDPQRVQREQMELYRKHKVNPMGGCLPMVVQVPIFYALYLTLQYSVELQGAPFVLWITDLSKKDPYYVLPILMGISMLVQQKMSPTVGDPRQARVMMVMPVVFTFMFLEFPSGLVLYWLVNNVLSVAQQYLIDRVTRQMKAAPIEARAEKESRKA